MTDAKASAPSNVQYVVNQNCTLQLNAQLKCLVIEPELETSQSRRIDQGDKLVLCAPRIVGRRRAIEPKTKDTIPGDSPSGKDFE